MGNLNLTCCIALPDDRQVSEGPQTLVVNGLDYVQSYRNLQRTAVYRTSFFTVLPYTRGGQDFYPEEIAALLKKFRHPRPNRTAKQIAVKAHDPQLQKGPVTDRAKSWLMLAIVAQLDPMVDAIREYNKVIEKVFTARPDSVIFQCLPGAGKHLAPRLLPGWGDDCSRHTSHEDVAVLTGTSPVPSQSCHYGWAISAAPALSLFALILIASLGSPPVPSCGPKNITYAKGVRGKVTARLPRPCRTSGSGLSTPCGLSIYYPTSFLNTKTAWQARAA